MREIYLDYASTTYLDPRVAGAMRPYFENEYGNPSSLHRKGRRAKEAVENARQTIAKILNCLPEEIIFTGSGSEAINLALLGTARAYKKHGKHIIASKIEHHAVLNALKALEKEGFEVTYLDVDKNGLINPEDVEKAISQDTILISIMYANNEIGTIEPVAETGAIIKKYRDSEKTPFFFIDACQAAGALELDVQKLGVDLLAVNGSKIYGPKGVGCLYVSKGIRPMPLVYGGGQENNFRSGTENVPGIVGLAKALEIAERERETENVRLAELRDYFIGRVLKEIPKTVLNGHKTKRLPNNVNITFLDIEGESALLYLDEKGIYISTGSACTSNSLEPSHVITALGRPYEHAHGSLRFTLGRKTAKEDLDYVLEHLPKVVEKLRRISAVRLENRK
ncbi:MAG: Cysteine desulfurase [Candidatus Azambacteria bacterium GW2011_GWA2_45_90]|uniref:Cysteine desulfurase n=1 Tax=Candidatus Azambacteria bacterium GW2011_GWA2_45_90 TaxID=1618614 RepID=A0A0G1R7T8_9BACT|nr:MAG: Cysteine desulfurase [Candidatus Azambacteria bacterium GW2011_GWA2_45_90]